MSLTRTLTTALAILALGAITAGCAGANVGLSFGPNRPMMQTAVPAEEPDDVEVADVPWDRCDGECRYRESMRICSTTIQVAGAQRQQAHAAFMRFGDRVSFRARVMQSCGGRVQYAGVSSRGAVRDNEPWLHRKPARVIKRPVGVTAPHFRCNARTGLPENPGNAWCGDLRR